ncbi:helix-turn-helix domain-containing protein [Paenibacillus albicereus]|uniref:Helix-turn-helix domain-containing protein n=1 Tax=Paenibacillus albicereus TaxID=2726185 RepID=A0A6H2GYX5_9BACL|nr:helix-turn-helix domain-containing protein [Paenibacillus albicereus]QJC52605.1 helix-turn-helix domain-containing protein [Paenibacillus albicereus]
MNALIVDDEIYAVKGLRAGVNWAEAGISEVYEAYGAEEARRLLLERDVDILICDIEMPEQTGLELVEWTRAEGLRLETVFLTCHSEFRFAQKALQLGSSDYILKPVIYAELEEVLRGLGRRIGERRRGGEESERQQQMAEQWRMQKPLVAERRWNDLLAGRAKADGRWLELAAGAADADPLELSRVRPLLIAVDQWEKPFSERDEQVMEFALRKAAEELLLAAQPGAVAEDGRGNGWVLLFEGKGGLPEEELMRLCDRYRRTCRDYFYCRMSVRIGGSVPVAELRDECRGVLEQARRARSPMLRQVQSYIAEHLDRELSREELAEQVHLNPAYLSRLFRKETGKVLTDYILQEKMNAAASRLLGTDESVSEIAAGLGYGNFSYFARLFRKVYGVNPQEYRKQGG